MYYKKIRGFGIRHHARKGTGSGLLFAGMGVFCVIWFAPLGKGYPSIPSSFHEAMRLRSPQPLSTRATFIQNLLSSIQGNG